MKTIKAVFLLLGLTLVNGCATSNVTAGKDFATVNIQKIVKGKTTSAELVHLVGQPYSKVVLSSTDEKWLYFYTESSSQAQSYVVAMTVKTTSHQKTLDVLISNGVVSNYTFTEGENPSAINVN